MELYDVKDQLRLICSKLGSDKEDTKELGIGIPICAMDDFRKLEELITDEDQFSCLVSQAQVLQMSCLLGISFL